jgi:transglutaminase-like putative cysteine protease
MELTMGHFARATAAAAALVAGIALAGPAAHAQAPVVTPAGDPSVRADTIYKLAVDPKAYPDESLHWLLDDGIVTVERNGHTTHTFRQVMQVLTESGARAVRERVYGYSPRRQRLRINWVRVVRPDGSVVSDAPTHQQESDVPAPVSANPIYGDARVIRMSLSGVEPGTIVDASYTVEDTLPALTGDFLQAWRVTPGARVERSRFIVDAPADLALRIRERNLSFKRTQHTANGRTTYQWATSNIDRIKPEAFAADSNGVVQTIVVSAPLDWNDIGTWYAGLARDRYAATPALRQKIAALTAGARTRMDTIRAIHRWVAQDVRYVGIELGQGGYQPRMPDSVIATGYGDCKDKATLFVTALRAVGITASPVLLSASGHAERDVPDVSQFNHEIAVVDEPNGQQRYTDLTAAYLPYGSLPMSEQGGFALVVPQSGAVREVTLPRDPIADDGSSDRIVGTLSPDGTFTGTFESREMGVVQGALRSIFAEPLDSARRANLVEAVARRFFAHGEGDSLTGFNGKDFAATPVVHMTLRATETITDAGDVLLFELPFHGPGTFDAESERKLTGSPRLFPIDAARVSPPGTQTRELRLTLPPGWKAKLPKDVVVHSIFGNYETHYKQDGRDVIITNTRSGVRGVYPPSRIGDLVAYLRAIGADNTKLLVLQKPAA